MIVLTAKFKTEPSNAEVLREIERCALIKHGIIARLVDYEIDKKHGVWLHRLAVDDFKGGTIRIYRIGTSDAHTELEEKISKQIESNKAWADSHGCAVSTVSVISCRMCGSKINTKAYRECVYNTHNGWHCPVCGHSLESMTYNANVRRHNTKLDKLIEQYKTAAIDSYYYLAVCHYCN